MSAAGKKCPFLGGKKCLEHSCAMWQQLTGKNPNTGAQVAEWDCSIRWHNILLIENSQMQRQTGAAVESFRNETVKNTQAIAAGIVAVSQVARLPEKVVGDA